MIGATAGSSGTTRAQRTLFPARGEAVSSSRPDSLKPVRHGGRSTPIHGLRRLFAGSSGPDNPDRISSSATLSAESSGTDSGTNRRSSGTKRRSKRDWDAAWAFVLGAQCLVCGRKVGITPAHLWPRSRGGDESEENIGALCAGPGSRHCHTRFDNGELDLGPCLTSAQRIRVVELAEAHNPGGGLNAAHRRLYPSLHREER